MTLLKVEGLTKTYSNQRGIKNLNLEIKPGELVALLGPNGSGKTTAMKAMLGLLNKNGGKVSFKGFDIEENLKEALKFTGTVVGKSTHYEYMSAYENLNIIRAFIKSITAADIDSTLERVGLYKYRNDKVKTFSTGMKQRLSIAKALLHRPELLILDEPFSGMDIEGKTEIIELLKKELIDNSLGILISSHQLADVEALVTKVCIVNESQWLCTEEASIIKQEYKSLEAYYLAAVQGKRRIAV